MTPDEAKNTDFESIGRELLTSHKGIQTDYGTVFRNEEAEAQEIYDGQVFPCYHYTGEELLCVEAEYKGKREYLYLPDEPMSITKALHRLGADKPEDCSYRVAVYHCKPLRGLLGKRLDGSSIKELIFFAKRLELLNEDEKPVLQAVVQKYLEGKDENQLVSIKDLINMTYGLDKVSVLSAVSNDAQLGQFVIENDLHPDIEKLPAESIQLLDRVAVGRWMRGNDGGVFVGDKYVVAGEYELAEVYDGITLPSQEQEERYVFRLKVSAPSAETGKEENSSQWLTLPAMRIEADRLAKSLGAEKIEDCVCIEFESVIPQIDKEDINGLSDFTSLNYLAGRFIKMSPEYRMKYKAVLSRERNFDLSNALKEIACHVFMYDFLPQFYVISLLWHRGVCLA